MGFMIDTCIWIDVERGALSPADVNSFTDSEPVYISPVTIAELKFGAENAKEPQIRQKRLAALFRLMRKPILKIDEITGEIFGSLAAQIKMAGRQHSYRVQDLWLASQSIQHGLSLLTYNRKDFEEIPGLSLVVIQSSSKKNI
jgi:predicted nucleic acid-binding protein